MKVRTNLDMDWDEKFGQFFEAGNFGVPTSVGIIGGPEYAEAHLQDEKKFCSTQSIPIGTISYSNRPSPHQDHYNTLIINILILNAAITSTYTLRHCAKDSEFLIYTAPSIVSPPDSMDA